MIDQRAGIALVALFLSACSSTELPVEIPRPDGEGEEMTTEDHHELTAPYASYRFNLSRDALLAAYANLLTDNGWKAFQDGNQSYHIAAAKDGKKVAVEIMSSIQDRGKSSEIHFQFGDPDLTLLTDACIVQAECCKQIVEHADLDEDSELFKKIDRLCITPDIGDTAICRTNLAITRSDISDADVEPGEIAACYRIPIDSSALFMLGKVMESEQSQ